VPGQAASAEVASPSGTANRRRRRHAVGTMFRFSVNESRRVATSSVRGARRTPHRSHRRASKNFWTRAGESGKRLGMGWERFSYTHEGARHTVPAEILRALGKGFLIGSAGLIIGLLVGTSSLAVTTSLGMIAGTAVLGGSCLVAAAAVRNALCRQTEAERETQDVGQVAKVVSLAADSPDMGLDHGEEAPAPGRRFVELVDGRRERSRVL
jgi:hypothetical protein